MKRLLNVLGALVSDLAQNELAARGPCTAAKAWRTRRGTTKSRATIH